MFSTTVRPFLYPLLQTGFQRAITVIILARMTVVLIPYPPASRKAGYIYTQRYAPNRRDAPHCRFKSASYTDPLTTVGVRPRTRAGLHGNRGGVTMPLEIALDPQA